MDYIFILDLIGTIAFVISGSLTAMHKKMDTFGIFIIGFITAIGGGTLRDLLVGNTPVLWMEEPIYVYVIGVTVFFTILFRNKIYYLRKSLFLFDTIGLAVFTIIGVEVGIRFGLNPIISMALGTMTGSFGGVIRDILCNIVPVIFRKKDIYATASLAGGGCYFVLKYLGLETEFIYFSTILLIIVIRVVAVRYSIKLPAFQVKEDSN